MTLHVGEIGKTIIHGTSYDMSSSTDLEMYLVQPDGTTVTVLNARLTAPASPYAAGGDIGTLAASTYFSFTSVALDFPVAGEYTIYGKYTDSTHTFYSEPDTITVHAVGA